MEEPDTAGHQFGPDSDQVREAVQKVDRVVGLLMDSLKQRGLHRCVNLVLLSDHGMEEASCDRAVYVSDYQTNVDNFVIIQGPAPRIRPRRIPEDYFSFDYEGLVKNLSCRVPDQPMRPYLKEDLPKRLHFANNLSHSVPCLASSLLPADNLGCTCNSSTQADYIIGFSKDVLTPLWVSYTLPPLSSALPLSPGSCVRADVRVPPAASQTCRRYRDDPALTYGLLHPPSLSAVRSQADSLLTSNMAPMFPAFKNVWTYIHDHLLPTYSQQLNGVNVVSGPVFDKNYDGKNEAPVPTHFFLVLTSCADTSLAPQRCPGPLLARSFLLPHRPDHTETCADASGGNYSTWVEAWMRLHVARVRDVELLSGLSFYQDRISVDETLQLKTFLYDV
ncbi:hypothetical protein CRUP_022756 [Coryphaenoides rupestris]|nr:hypothetical protein CRUP_022756 [Coryphaenoides rupestris]